MASVGARLQEVNLVLDASLLRAARLWHFIVDTVRVVFGRTGRTPLVALVQGLVSGLEVPLVFAGAGPKDREKGSQERLNIGTGPKDRE